MKSLSVPWREAIAHGLIARRCVLQESTATGATWSLDEIASVSSGQYVAEYVEASARDAVPYIRVDTVRQFLPNLSPRDTVYIDVRSVGAAYERVSVRTGDVIIARTATLGKAVLVGSSLNGAVMSQHISRIRLRAQFEGSLPPIVLAAYINSAAGRRQILSLASGSTRPELLHHHLSKLRVPQRLRELEWTPEESRLVDDLQATLTEEPRKAITVVDELINNSTEPNRALLQHFSCACDKERLVESMLPRFYTPTFLAVEAELTERYVCKSLGELFEIKRGAGTTSREYEDAGIAYYRTSSFINYGVDLFPDWYGSEETYSTHAQSVADGDLLLTIEGKIGEAAVLGPGERALLKNHIEVLRPRDTSVSPEFVCAFLLSRTGRAQLERRMVVQATIPGLASASREVLVPIAGRTKADQQKLNEAVAVATNTFRAAIKARVELRRVLGTIRDAAGQRATM